MRLSLSATIPALAFLLSISCTQTKIIKAGPNGEAAPGEEEGTGETETDTDPTNPDPTNPTPTVGKQCSKHSDCTAKTEYCGDDKKCTAIPPGGEIGWRDGSASSVDFVQIYKAADDPAMPGDQSAADFVDLAFNASKSSELWVIGYGDDSVHIGSDISATSNGKWQRRIDPARAHFMHAPPAIAMGAAPFWATCGDGDDSFASRQPRMFMGPALFTTDLAIFAKPAGTLGLGSHYDMLHSSPFCKGIAHQDANIFWVYNGHDKAIDKYDFHNHHGPGMDDHSDGEIWRYANAQLTPVTGAMSHLTYDANEKMLYIADTGAGRIAKLDTTKGTPGGTLPRRNEPLVKQGYMLNTNLVDVVAPGTLKKPSGLEIKGNLVYVTDTETSTFHVFEKATGKEVRKLATGFPAGTLAGFTFGPDGKVWFTDRKASRVVRIDPK